MFEQMMVVLADKSHLNGRKFKYQYIYVAYAYKWAAMTNSQAGLKRRSACDRCRSQKLRCLRRPGEETCTRCLNSQSQCIFGASRRGLRPQTGRQDEPILDQRNGNVESPSIEADISNATSTELMRLAFSPNPFSRLPIRKYGIWLGSIIARKLTFMATVSRRLTRQSKYGGVGAADVPNRACDRILMSRWILVIGLQASANYVKQEHVEATLSSQLVRPSCIPSGLCCICTLLLLGILFHNSLTGRYQRNKDCYFLR